MLHLEDYVKEFNRALQVEIEHQKENGGRLYIIQDGLLLDNRDHFIYRFVMDQEMSLPDGTPVYVKIDDKTVPGNVISLEGFDLILALEQNIGTEVHEAQLICEPWFLLEALQKRLEKINQKNTFLASSVLTGNQVKIKNPEQLKTGQQGKNCEVCRFVLNNAVVFIWGPPGTGKTETLARITNELLSSNERVLILSHSNVAVDEAVARIASVTSTYKEGDIVRYGFAQPAFLAKHRNLTSFYLAAKRRPELLHRYEQLKSEREKLKKIGRSKELASVEKELSNCRQEIRALEVFVIGNAKAVGTTLSKSVIDEAVFNSSWDTVIVDEVSMAYIPNVIFAASLAKRRIVLIGDFRQLAPIAMATAPLVNKWLKRDIFEKAGIVKAVDSGMDHPCLISLTIQHRMHPRIAGFPSIRFYGGRLENAPDVAKNVEPIIKDEPFPGEPLIMFDLSGLDIGSCILPDYTRFNLFSAFASISLAINSGKNNVAIITPYVAQGRLLRALISDLYPFKEDNSTPKCRASTVHKFQGSQSDLVIFDTVDSSGRPGTLVSSIDESSRLINVAVTRAKGKLILVCKRSYLEDSVSKNMPIRWLIQYAREKGKHYRLLNTFNSDLLGENDSKHLIWLENEKDIRSKLKEEIKNAKKIIGEFKSDWLESKTGQAILEELDKPDKNVVIKCNSTSPLKGTSLENDVIIKNFIPYSALLLIDNKVIWCGAQVRGEDRYLWVRYSGPKGVISIAGLLDFDLNKINDKKIVGLQDFVKSKSKCPLCGNPMTARLSKKGKIFLGCTTYPSCEGIKWLDIEIANEYLSFIEAHCPQCGSNLVARKGRNGLFVGCSNFPDCKMTFDLKDYLK
ncbi:AAA domain-containing protein [Moorella sp. E306M]|uniref:AAA domain-containing protein n=1 Tax=Moorella sp. E306M TaxID=2572683 RepID=UPI0010FFC67B|nr:AAA domain-containing protein [Moorella sp. E306M]GEA18933.1 disulfide oxidoreductase [Moorella sp. E306M]